MEFLKTLFGIKQNDKSINLSGIKSENYIKIINDQISNLVNIGLSPIPSTKEDKMLQQSDLNRSLIRIVYFLDILLMDRLTLIQNTDKKLDKLSSNHSLNANSERHYWVYISKYFNIPSVKFLTMYDLFKNNQEKGLAWLTISILENTLLDSFKQIYTMNFDKKFYEKDANIIERKSEILKSLEKLSNFNLLNSFNVDIYKDYINDKNQRNANRENMKDFDMGLDVPGMSPIKKPKTNNDFIITPIDLMSKNLNGDKVNQINNNPNYYIQNLNSNFQPSSNFYNSKENISTLNIYQSKMSFQNTRDLNSKAEDIYKLINADESGMMGIDENDDLLPENDEDKEAEDIKEKDHPRNTRIITPNDMSFHYKENKNLGAVKKGSYFNNQITLNSTENVTTYNISKYMDIQQCLKENYFSNLFNTANISAGKKDIGIVPAFANRDSRYFPFDKYFRINKKTEKEKFTKKDIIYYNNTQIKMTNSIVFYLNNFFKKMEFFVFDTKLSNERPITIEAQNFQCQLCRQKFPSYYNIFPFRKIFWCSYYKRYICEACVSDEFSIIPAFVLKNWNFQKFSVSKEAIDLLKKWYEKPIIYFKSNDPLIKISSMLRQAIIIKRKIHKIYDIMKCSNPERIATEVLGEYSYLVLKENLFSLKDLWEIHNGSFILKMKDFLFKLENHIKSECQVCNYKGGICAMCATGELITAYDIENAFFCNECNSLFHKKCCSVHPCLVNKM